MIDTTLIGKTIGIWKVECVSEEKDKYGHYTFDCYCTECGFYRPLRKVDLREDLVARTCTHTNQLGNHKEIGFAKWKNKRIHKIFKGMIRRCYSPNDKSYRWYGAKGIIICEEWLNHPEKFEEWALTNGYQKDLTIDRINSDKDYCPENCRWITAIDNSKYKKNNYYIRSRWNKTHWKRMGKRIKIWS